MQWKDRLLSNQQINILIHSLYRQFIFVFRIQRQFFYLRMYFLTSNGILDIFQCMLVKPFKIISRSYSWYRIYKIASAETDAINIWAKKYIEKPELSCTSQKLCQKHVFFLLTALLFWLPSLLGCVYCFKNFSDT